MTNKWPYILMFFLVNIQGVNAQNWKDQNPSVDHRVEVGSSVWMEYEIVFVSPGFYVNTWNAERIFKTASKEALPEALMQGLKIDSHKVERKRNLKIKIPIHSEYGKPVRLKLKTLKAAIKHESIKILPPGEQKPFVISSTVAESK